MVRTSVLVIRAMAASKYFKTFPKPSGFTRAGDIERIKAFGSDRELEGLFASTVSNSQLEQSVFLNAFPKDFKALKKGTLHKYWDLAAELRWLAYTFRYCSKNINSILKIVDLYEKQAFLGDWSKAIITLEQITREYGVSVWLLKQWVLVYEEHRGLDAQKRFVEAIVNDDEADSVLRFLAHYVSTRTERTVSYSRFDQQVVKAISSLRKGEKSASLAEYVDFHLGFYSDRRISSFLSVLVSEGDSAVIDRYFTYRRIAQVILARNSDVATIRALKHSLAIIGSRIDDPLLAILQCSVNLHGAALSPIDERLQTAIDSFTLGKYTLAIEAAVSALKDAPEQFPAYEIIAKSSVYTAANIDSLSLPQRIADILRAMRSVITADTDARQSHELLLKSICSRDSTGWSAQAFWFLQKEFSHFSKALPQHYAIFSALNSVQQPNPRLPEALRAMRRQVPQTFCPPSLRRSASYQVVEAVCSSEDSTSLQKVLSTIGVPEERYYRVLGDYLLQRAQYSEAKMSYGKAETIPAGREHFSAFVGRLKSMIGLGEIGLAVEACADALLERPNLWAKLPLPQLLSSALQCNDEAMRSSSALPIAFEFYSRYIDNAYDTHKVDACEDYLLRVGVQCPSEIPAPTEARLLFRLIFFLKYVCIPTVLDSLPWTAGSVDVQQKRLAICQRLLEIDAHSGLRDDYEAEIKEITKTLTTSRGLRAVEQSKIYVDVDGLRQGMQIALADSYKRFTTIISTRPKAASFARLAMQLSSLQIGDVTVMIPQDESLEILRTIIIEIRDQFARNNEFGLNSSLSMGIRHGTLSGQIRPVFEQAHLVTQKNEKTNVYSANTYWAGRLNTSSSATVKALLNRLEVFSHEVDEYIDFMNEKLIQIKTEDGNASDAFFDLSITDIFIVEIFAQVDADTTFERFIESVLERFWAMTDTSLLKARSYFKNEAKEVFLQKLNKLRDEISVILHGTDYSEIDGTCADAMTEIQYCMERVSSWFTRARAEELGDFEISLPIMVANEMIANVYRDQRLKIETLPSTTLMVKGKVLTPFCNIFFNLLDNCRKHGRRTINGDSDLKISSSVQDNWLRIELKNPIDPILSVDVANEELNDIKGLVGDSRRLGQVSLSKVAKEGRSGFHKIAKLIYYDIGVNYRLDMKFDGNEFMVVIELEYEKIKP